MAGFLWDHIAFGPIHSRRLGSSLGINVLPTDVKLCSFDCLYCECGWSLKKVFEYSDFYTLSNITTAIEQKLKLCQQEHTLIDSITFSGNGEPTLHPNFLQIVNFLIIVRNQYYPKTIISCLSNSTQLYRPDVKEALLKIDNPLLKLDAGTTEMLQAINRPTQNIQIENIVNHLQDFNGKLGIQTLFFKGFYENKHIDNTSEKEINLWLQHLQKIKPEKVWIYSLDRETPALQLQKIDKSELEKIAVRVRNLNIKASVY